MKTIPIICTSIFAVLVSHEINVLVGVLSAINCEQSWLSLKDLLGMNERRISTSFDERPQLIRVSGIPRLSGEVARITNSSVSPCSLS